MTRVNAAEFNSLVPPQPPWSRRGFMQGGVAAGFAAAVLPVAATTLRTPHTGLVSGEVMVPSGDWRMPVYRAAPAHVDKPPVVLVVSEIFGVHEHIADVARRFAHAGYMALAPELFERQGDPTAYGEVAKIISEVVSKVPDAQVLQDLDACVAWAQAQGADTSRLGITGFCWGGRITWLYAAHNPAVRAGVAWYGRLAGPPTPLQPRQPVDVVDTLHAPVLGLYGGADAGIPLDDVARMRTRLAGGSAAAQASQIHVYPDAPHAFHADYRASYRESEARDGWRRCLDWLAQQGAGPARPASAVHGPKA